MRQSCFNTRTPAWIWAVLLSMFLASMAGGAAAAGDPLRPVHRPLVAAPLAAALKNTTAPTAKTTVITPAIVPPTAVPTFQAVNFSTPQIGLAAGRGFIWQTDDGGRQWTRGYVGSVNITEVHSFGRHSGYAWGRFHLLITANGSKRWRIVHTTSQPIDSVSFPSPAIVYLTLGVSHLQVQTTTDAGRSWTPLPNPAALTTIVFASAKDGWGANRYGTI